ncbi:28 kda ribonucleoprotein [Phaffia rhodozyma]|uniref:28 kDa ribonucleoprotein n=1 Tax=Phaffia rhodozyma TaxID=264483 RepID=A0A0F7SR41_PHARH|nr:28 kda ribonucleoprotein [Phaffia rhodozyma]
MSAALFRSLRQALPVASRLPALAVRVQHVSVFRTIPSVVSIRSFGEYGNKPSFRSRREPREPREPNPPSAHLFVANLSYDVTESDINTIIEPFGPTSIRVAADPDGQPKGFGFIDFADTESAVAARGALEGIDLYGREVRIDYATGPKDRAAPRARDPSDTLFFSGIQDLSRERLAEWLESYAQGSHVSVRTTVSRDGAGLAFAEFDNIETASLVKQQIEGLDLDGVRFTKIDFNIPRREPTGGNRGGYSGGNRGGYSGGNRGQRSGDFGVQREGGFRGNNREGGFRGGNRDGGFRGGNREGGFRGGNREGGFRGGNRGGSRDGSYRGDRE